MSNRIWFDTEFIEDGKTIELISIGMVDAEGISYYAENGDCDLSRAGEWVQKNVIPHLDGHTTPRAVIAQDIIEFVGNKPEFWAYFASYDWIVLCQLYGPMMDLPPTWPMHVLDVQQVRYGLGNPDLPQQPGTQHNALQDALWTKQAWTFLAGL